MVEGKDIRWGMTRDQVRVQAFSKRKKCGMARVVDSECKSKQEEDEGPSRYRMAHRG